jgi:hypothetical protein
MGLLQMANDAAKNQPQASVSEYYGDGFYKSQMDGSLSSARRFVDHLSLIFKPHSVVDLGCGRGTWLKAFKDCGAEKVVGFDGSWNSQDNMVDQSIVFFSVDLNKPLAAQEEKYDLAISLEVAEHLEESCAATFVESLAKLSDVVMFGAAYTGQGGTNHINEQPCTYWAKIFKEHDYMPYDLFRPQFWGNPDVDFWYQQNTFLYVKGTSALHQKLSDAGYQPLKNIAFMDCIHPILHDVTLSQTRTKAFFRRLVRAAIPVVFFRRLVRAAIPEPLRPFARKIKEALVKPSEPVL